MEVKGICQAHSLLYEAYAMSLVAGGKLVEAHEIFQLGISKFDPSSFSLSAPHYLGESKMTMTLIYSW